MHSWRAGATPQYALGYMFSSAEGVLALPAMIESHATLYPDLDVGSGAFPISRKAGRVLFVEQGERQPAWREQTAGSQDRELQLPSL